MPHQSYSLILQPPFHACQFVNFQFCMCISWGKNALHVAGGVERVEGLYSGHLQCFVSPNAQPVHILSTPLVPYYRLQPCAHLNVAGAVERVQGLGVEHLKGASLSNVQHTSHPPHFVHALCSMHNSWDDKHT